MQKGLRITFAAGLISALLIGYLVWFGDLRIERGGSGMWPIISWYDREQHMAAIEARTAASRPEPPVSPVVEPLPSDPQAPVAPPKPVAVNAYWTDFRGPRRDGRYDEKKILTNWPSAGPPLLWKRPVGGGYASVVIANGNVFTIEQRRDKETVVAYRLDSGDEVWSHGWTALFQESMGGDGPRATPVWNDGRVYALGATGELRCLNAETGSLIWRKNILTDNGAANLQWGMAAAPLIAGDHVIVLPGGPGKSVAAYDKLSGKPAWQALDDKQAYTSPMLVTLGGERQLLIVTATRAVGLTLNGRVLWEYPWTTSYDINAAQPVVVGADSLILSAGYGHGAALVRISKENSSYRAVRVWESTRMKNKFTSSVLHEGHIYGLDESILACVDAGTGELKWKGGRYGYGQIVLASGHIIVVTEDGDIALVRANPEKHEEIVRFPAISGKTWNHPAIGEGVLVVRNGAEMAAFQIQ